MNTILRKTVSIILVLLMAAGLASCAPSASGRQNTGESTAHAGSDQASDSQEPAGYTKGSDESAIEDLSDEMYERAVRVSDIDELADALSDASIDENDPTVILITGDIEQSADSPEDILTVPEGKYVLLASDKSSSGECYSVRQMARQSQSGCAVIMIKGSLTLRNINIDAGKCTRGLYVERGGVLTLGSGALVTGGTTTSKNICQGLGVYVAGSLSDGLSYGTLIIQDGAAISGNTHESSKYGRALGIGVYAGGHVEMNGGEIRDNVDLTDPVSSEQRAAGGGIYVKSSVSSADTPWAKDGVTNLTMNSGSISGNAAFAGGGIYISDYSNVDIQAGSISGNTADYAGGGIATDGQSGSTDNMTKLLLNIGQGAVISGNTAFAGGGIYAGNGQMKINGAKITGNTAMTSEDTPQPKSTLCPFASAGGSGGGLYIVQVKAEITGAEITDNAAVSDVDDAAFPLGNGGGVYMTNAANYIYECSLTMSDCTVTGNTAEGSGTYSGFGGGVCAGFQPIEDEDPYVPEINILSGMITGNTAVKGGDLAILTEMSYKTRGYGGTEYGVGTSEGLPIVAVHADAQIEDIYPEDVLSEAEDGRATTGGNDDKSDDTNTDAGTREGDDTGKDQDGQDHTDDSDARTGEEDNEVISLPGTSMFSEDAIPQDAVRVSESSQLIKAAEGGEAFIMLSDNIRISEPVVISADTVIFGAGHTLSYEGGDADAVIKAESGTAVIDSLFIESGSVRCLYVKEGAGVTVNNSVLSGRSLMPKGVSVYNEGNLVISGSLLTKASIASTSYLGLIYNAGTFTAKDGFAVDSESYVYSGTIYNEGTFYMEGGTFGGTGSNSSRKNFGAAVTNLGTFTMSGGTITGCRNSEAVLSKGMFIMNGGSISDNITTCVSGMTYNSVLSGGGVLVYGGSFEMYEGAVISGNTGYMGAGVGVYFDDAVFNMYGGVISGNTAMIDPSESTFNKNNGCGGGVGVYGGAEFNLYGGSITGNRAYIGDSASIGNMGSGGQSFAGTGLGGGIYVLEGTVNIDGGSITGNTASSGPDSTDGGQGGGIYIRDNGRGLARVNITSGIITGNVSENAPGNDIFSGSSEEPTADVICLYMGGDASIGDVYLGTNRTLAGIGSEITTLNVESLSCNGRESVGSVIVRYAEGLTAQEGDAGRMHFAGVSGLKASADGRELVIDMLDLSKVTAVTIDDVVFTGKEIQASSLNAHLTVSDIWQVDAAGLAGLRAESVSDNVNAGTAYITLRGDNVRYTGQLENVPFNILPAPLEGDGLTVIFEDPDAVYIADGTRRFTPEIKIMLDAQSSDDNPVYLKEGAEGDYTVSYGDNTEAGTGYIYAEATGSAGSNFTGSRIISFEIFSVDAVGSEIPFADVSGSADPAADDYQYYYEPVYWAVSQGICEGSDPYNAVFGVGEKCSKGDMLIMLWKYAGSPEDSSWTSASDVFEDVGKADKESDIYKAAAWGYESGVVCGTESDGLRYLCLDSWLSRADMAVMLWRYAGKPGRYGKMKYADVTQAGYKSSDDMYRAVMWITKENIAKGYKDEGGRDIFGLTKGCFKEYIVTYIYRYSEWNEG